VRASALLSGYVRFDKLKAEQRESWDSVPWERLARRIAGLHDDLVRRLNPQPGERWLDVATGTGGVALRAARAGVHVTGLDLAPGMIETARRLAAESGLSVRFDVGDAERLPYEDARFDVVSSALGVEEPPDHVAVAHEFARVCRLGGRLGLAHWRPDPEWEEVREPFQPVRDANADIGTDWGREEYAANLLGSAFELEFSEGEVRLTGESGEAIWRFSTSPAGPLKEFVDSMDRNRREQFHRAYVEYYERYRTESGVSVPKKYMIILGRRV
jgi:SAM-dependent methyltransferase